jgi:hypothetical protein
MSPDQYRAVSMPVRAGLALGAIACLLAGIGSLGDLMEGPSRGRPAVEVAVGVSSAVTGVLLVALVLMVFAIAAPWYWAHLTAIALLTAAVNTAGIALLAARTADDFAVDSDPSPSGGGTLVLLAFWVGVAALIVTLVGFRRVAQAVPAEGTAAPPAPDAARPPSAPKARASLVLSILGVIASFAASLGVALGVLALGEIRGAGGRLGGRGIALAGVVIGISILTIWLLVVGALMLSASPTD